MGFNRRASNTYRLNKVYVTGCNLQVMYHLKSIGIAGTTSKSYITILRMSDIDDVYFDEVKSKPNGIMLIAGKKASFETYELKDKIYVPSTAVKHLSLFIDMTNVSRRGEIVDLLKTQVRQCGGKKLKI